VLLPGTAHRFVALRRTPLAEFVRHHSGAIAYPGVRSSVTNPSTLQSYGLVVASTQVMSTQAITVERKLTRYFRAPNQSVQESRNIAMRVSVASDANRIFQVLTSPEYLETWITLPGDSDDSYLVAWQDSGSYRIDHYQEGRRDLMITGDYRICRRRKMLFTWRTSGDRAGSESLVYIGLHGNFSSTILELHHRGITSAAEHTWQQEMWHRSLDRLVRLFEC
jgi:activator of Hsp90 ATPase-like protein